MGRPQKEPPSPSPLPPAILRLLRERGVDARLVAERLGLPPDAERADEAAITADGFEALLDAAAHLLDEPFLALSLPELLPLRRYSLPELAARASASVRDGMKQVQKYSSLFHPQLEMTLDESGGEARWCTRMRGRPRGVGRHSHEYQLAIGLGHIRREAGRPIVVKRVWFIHPRPRELQPLERFFGTDQIDFGCLDNGYALPSEVLDLAVSGADPRLLATVEPLAEAALAAQPPIDDFAAQVGARLRTLLPDGASMEAVAAAMHMSARTLQRRLEQEGTRFIDVLDGVREQLAKQWLGDRAIALQEISWRLGFADLATFSRAFKRWTGKPPGTWRRG